MSYFKDSQMVKRHIKETEIPRRLKKCYSKDKWNSKRQKYPKLIGKGSISAVHRIGKLKHKYVAYRRVIDKNAVLWFEKKFDHYLKLFENYYRTAEEYKKDGKRVPSFSIGVLCREDGEPKEAGLIVEDLTAGGRLEINDKHAREFGFIRGTGEKVYYDLDDYSDIDYDKIDMDDLKYMSEDAMIHIDI